MQMITMGAVQLEGVTPDRWQRIKTAAGQNDVFLSGNHGTATVHGVVIAYAYLGTELTVTIMHVPTFLGHQLITEEAAKDKLQAWLESIQ